MFGAESAPRAISLQLRERSDYNSVSARPGSTRHPPYPTTWFLPKNAAAQTLAAIESCPAKPASHSDRSLNRKTIHISRLFRSLPSRVDAVSEADRVCLGAHAGSSSGKRDGRRCVPAAGHAVSEDLLRRCHNPKRTEGELDLTRYKSAAALGEHFRQWEHVVTFLRREEMPPEKAKQPTSDERAEILATIEKLMAAEAKKLAGDPGVVLPRRLTNAEYNYTIRDLTGVDIRPAESFPIDPASGEGFNNTGEALVMSPNLFKKYYAAAQHVADHVRADAVGNEVRPLTRSSPSPTRRSITNRRSFASTKSTTSTTKRISRPPGRFVTVRRRSPGRDDRSNGPSRSKLSPKYLRMLWDTLNGASGRRQVLSRLDPATVGRSAAARRMRTSQSLRKSLRKQIGALADNIRRTSKLLCAKETPAIVSNAGNGPVQHIDRRKKTAAERDTFDANFIRRSPSLPRRVSEAARPASHQDPSCRPRTFRTDAKPGYVILKDLNFSTQSANDYRPRQQETEHARSATCSCSMLRKSGQRLKPGVHPLGHAIDPDSVVLSTSAPLEITVPTKAFADRQDIRFFVEAALDREHSQSGIVRFALSDRPAACG